MTAVGAKMASVEATGVGFVDEEIYSAVTAGWAGCESGRCTVDPGTGAARKFLPSRSTCLSSVSLAVLGGDTGVSEDCCSCLLSDSVFSAITTA